MIYNILKCYNAICKYTIKVHQPPGYHSMMIWQYHIKAPNRSDSMITEVRSESWWTRYGHGKSSPLNMLMYHFGGPFQVPLHLSGVRIVNFRYFGHSIPNSSIIPLCSTQGRMTSVNYLNITNHKRPGASWRTSACSTCFPVFVDASFRFQVCVCVFTFFVGPSCTVGNQHTMSQCVHVIRTWP